MLPPNVIEILKKLDKREFKKLGDFIKSPYFNSIAKLGDLYDVIYKIYPDFHDAKLNDRKIFKKLYSGKEYKDKTVKNLYTEFGKTLRRFITYEEFDRDQCSKDLKLVNALSRVGDYDASSKVIKEMNERYRHKDLGEEYFLSIYKSECIRYNNLLKKDKVNLKEVYACYYSIVENLTCYFFSEFSNIGFSILVFEKAYKVNIDSEERTGLIRSLNIQDFPEHLDKFKTKYSDVTKIYHLLLYHLLNDFTREDLIRLKELMVKNAGICTKKNLLNFWSNLTDLITMKLSSTDKNYYRDIFELAEFFYSLKLSYADSPGKFPLYLFRNIVFTGILLEELEWTERFINEYGSQLEEEKSEDETNYSNGILHFYYKNYDTSISLMSRVKFTDIYENINVRFYYVMNYIEMKHYDSAAAMINSIRQLYNASKEIPEMLSLYIKDSIKYFNEIMKCLENNVKLDYAIYKKASGPGKFIMKKYIVKKMKKLL